MDIFIWLVHRLLGEARETYRSIRPTSLSIFHLSRNRSLYSFDARSRPSTTPSFSDAFAFHSRTFPSSEPDMTNRASCVYAVANTLHPPVKTNAPSAKMRETHLCIRFPVYAALPLPSPSFHILTLRSHPPLTNSCPVGDHPQDMTAATWPL
jgi:hypothetical protein